MNGHEVCPVRVEQTAPTERLVPPQKFPRGLTLILVWIGITILSSSLVNLTNRELPLAWVTLKGTAVIVYTLAKAVLLGACGYGILRRKAWARNLTIGWYVFSFALSVHTIYLGLIVLPARRLLEPQDVMPFTLGVTQILVWEALGLGIDAIIIAYLYRNRGFFR